MGNPKAMTTWQSAILAYASDRCGVRFTSLREADQWLIAHPDGALNPGGLSRLNRPCSRSGRACWRDYARVECLVHEATALRPYIGRGH
jgi:hypothetical protein